MTGRRRDPWWERAPKVNRDPALTVECPQCGVPAGTLCIDSRARLVHPERRAAAYRAEHGTT